MKPIPSIDNYAVEIEILSPTCVGGIDAAGESEETKYHSYEYHIENGLVYFISNRNIANLYYNGLLTDRDLEMDYSELVRKIISIEEAKKYLTCLPLADSYDNKIEIFRFAKSLYIEDDTVKEIPSIFGSTMKGILRTGYAAARLKTVRYKFDREPKSPKRLKLHGMILSDKGDQVITKNHQIYSEVFDKDDYIISIKGEDIEGVELDHVNLIFSNIMCSDLKLSEGRMVLEKISRIHRKSRASRRQKNSGIPQYFETPEVHSKFKGNIIYKYDNDNIVYEYDGEGSARPLSLYSCIYSGERAEIANPVEECFYGLKKLSKLIIRAEKKMLSHLINGELDEFYKMLEEENEKPSQFVFKLGYSGMLAKTFMSLDEKNLENDDFLPYTLNVVEKTKIPTGWVKCKWELQENET